MQPKPGEVDRLRWATFSTATHPNARGTRCSRAPTSPVRTTSRCTRCSARSRATTSRSAARRATGPSATRASRSRSRGRSGRSRSTSCPRIIDADEWAVVEAGVRQRVLALERFLADVYGPGEILADGVVPRRLVASSSHFHRCVAGLDPAGGVRVHVAGIDLVRDGAGAFRVLEDNLRTPSGISYVIENRRAMTHVFPELFASHRIRRVADYPQRLLEAFRATAPPGVDDPCVVVLTPGHPQRRVLRALVPGPPDGRRAGRGPRPRVPRPARLHAHDRGRAAGRRRVPPRRRRLPRPGALPARLGARLRGHPQRGARRQRHHRQRARATASPTTRPSTRTCPR